VNRIFDDIDWPMKKAVLKLYRATDDLGALTDRAGRALEPLRLPALVVWGEGTSTCP
jgi:hypothetical protein